MVVMTPTLTSITFDCVDAARLAGFWAAVLDRPVADGASAGYAVLAGTPAWSFLQVPEPKQAKNRMHVDLGVDDLPGSVERIVGLGATHLGAFEEEGERWATLADPEGNEFDVAAA